MRIVACSPASIGAAGPASFTAPSHLLWWRRTLPLQPVTVAALVGVFVDAPLGNSRAESVLYFATAGVASAFAYDVVKAWAKRHGYAIEVEVVE